MGAVFENLTEMDDLIERQALLGLAYDISEIDGEHFTEPCMVVDVEDIQKLSSIKPQEPKTGRYEKHIDHTDCIWYGSDSGCPVTCSQYRDGWNDAMDYIFKNGKGYQPYRHDG